MGRDVEGHNTSISPKKKNTTPWIIAGVFGAIILVVEVLAFVSRPAPSESEIPPAEASEVQEEPPQSVAAAVPTCGNVVDLALQASDERCRRIGASEVCYGNNTVEADLTSEAGTRFDVPGDTVPIDQLGTLFTAPLDPATNEWGIAVFKLQANLPGTIPGQVVTMLVTGNISLENISGDMHAFYFTTGLGRVRCEEVPFDGVVVDMPDGAGVALQVNDAQLSLQGTAMLEAEAGESMSINLLDGIASIVADGREQPVAAGQSVTIPLNRTLQVSGPPSTPRLISPNVLTARCLTSPVSCGSGQQTAALPEAGSVALPDSLPLGGGQGGSGQGTVRGPDGETPAGSASSGTSGGGTSGDSGSGTSGGSSGGSTTSGSDGNVTSVEIAPGPGGSGASGTGGEGTGIGISVPDLGTSGDKSGSRPSISNLDELMAIFTTRMLTVTWIVLGLCFVALVFIILDQRRVVDLDEMTKRVSRGESNRDKKDE